MFRETNTKGRAERSYIFFYYCKKQRSGKDINILTMLWRKKTWFHHNLKLIKNELLLLSKISVIVLKYEDDNVFDEISSN